jgi:biopolymer transport protein ExbD
MASVQMGARGGRGPIVGINVTPFVDITLVLLIIMMVSSTYIVSQTLKVELPKTATSDQGTPRTAVVTIHHDGALLFNDQPTTVQSLSESLAAMRKKEDISLVVTADKAAQHGRVVEVIDAAKSVNVTKFAINVDRRK